MHALKRFCTFFLIVALFFGAGGCAPRQVLLTTVRPFLSSGYGESESIKASHFKLIDDFAARDFKNQIGGVWTKEVSTGSSLQTRYTKEEAVSPYGYCLEVKYSLAKAGRATLHTNLNGLDISKAQTLSLWFAYTAHHNPALKVKIIGKRGTACEIDITRRLSPSSKNWQEVSVPLTEWKGIDFNQLEGFEFIIQSKDGEEGSFLLDHISFFGPEDVFFESLKDNLRGFPKVLDVDRRKLLQLNDENLLRQVARDTWGYFENVVDQHHQLPLNRIKLSWRKEIGDYTSPTDIGLYYLATICASELGFISRAEALSRILRSLKTVGKLPKWKGFLYNYYNTTNLQVTGRLVSSLDDAWLAASLMVVKATFPSELNARVSKLLKRMDFYELYDAGEEKFNLGYDPRAKKFSGSHYGLLATEARIISLVAIAKGDVEPEHWFRIHRVLPREWKWQNQMPQGTFKEYRGSRVFEGYYTYSGKKIVPSWGGSLFEFLMPTLVLKERELAPASLGANDLVAAEVHRDYALSEKRYPVWGISPCMIDRGPRSAYLELGIKGIGSKGYKDEAVITPYASFLALEFLPSDVLLNIRRLLNLYPIYGEYGFYDSIAVRGPKVAKQYLALDQAMILISITNYLKNGIIRERFHSLNETRKVESILSEERFFEA